ncbi:MAG: succinylglutamate desuccinylase/aspartoacylase family protein [Phycisphaerales bacterium]
MTKNAKSAAESRRPASGSWAGAAIQPGQRGSVKLVVGQTYSGATVQIPLHVVRGAEDGPVVSVTAAVHGDEINGTGAIREMISEPPFEVVRGTVVFVPVINPFGFERHSRYLPDRRDLNRSFPGSATGSLAARLAHAVFDGIIRHCTHGIDLHTAAVRRTNYPNVRADLSQPEVATLARNFGAEVLVNSSGPEGSLRRSACDAGIPTIILEAGEVWKVEPNVLEYAVRGVRNCLVGLGMVDGSMEEPPYHIEVEQTRWVRADRGGFLKFHVAPGDTVETGEVIATNTSLVGRELNQLVAPKTGIVLGMATNPAVAPGDPIVHIGFDRSGAIRRVDRAMLKLGGDALEHRMRDDLATNVVVSDQPDGDGDGHGGDRDGGDGDARVGHGEHVGPGGQGGPGAEGSDTASDARVTD